MPNRCYMCEVEEETSDHIVLHCPKARMLWQLVFYFFNVQWVMHSLVRGVLLSWGDSLVGKKIKEKGLESCSFMPFLFHSEGKE